MESTLTYKLLLVYTGMDSLVNTHSQLILSSIVFFDRTPNHVYEHHHFHLKKQIQIVAQF